MISNYEETSKIFVLEKRLQGLRDEFGIDSFKFDAGESNWLPSSLILSDKIEESYWPAAFTTSYVDAVSKFGSMIEVRVGRRTQNYPIFVRMLDKDSHWGYDNGLKTLLTTLLQMSMVGRSKKYSTLMIMQ